MPAQSKKTARLCRRCSWSDLPHELLGDILRRIPALSDRLRFRAVCQQWRRAELEHPPPPMPWLAAAGHCVGIHEAAIHRASYFLPEDVRAAACRGSFGNWLAMVPMSSAAPYHPFLVNPFTMARVQLPAWTREGTICKMVLSSSPDDPGNCCTVAAIVGLDYTWNLRRGSIAVCRIVGGAPSSSWRCITETFRIEDIAFFQGKLHAIDAAEQAYAFEDGELEEMRDSPLYHRDPGLAAPPLSAHRRYYLVPCNGRLLVVCRRFGTSRFPGHHHGHHTVGFTVYPASEHSYGSTTPPPTVPVKSFDGHVLFVGDACCGAFTTITGSKIKEDQICYTDDEMSALLFQQQVDDQQQLEGWFTSSRYHHHHRPVLRLLQSYDLRTDCFRRYQPPCNSSSSLTTTTTTATAAAGPWECVTVQRLLHRDTLPPPPATEWGAALLLWEVMSSLGASQTPSYCRSSRSCQQPDTYGYEVDLRVLVYDQSWLFTRSGTSTQEAKQEAARQALTFLRSRYRSVLDDSPWSTIPHYHNYVDEDVYDYEELEL